MLRKVVLKGLLSTLLFFQILYSSEERSAKFDFFINTVKPFNFNVTNKTTDTGENLYLMESALSLSEKRFAIYSIFLATKHFKHIGGNDHPLLGRIEREYQKGFIYYVVEEFLSFEHDQAEPKKKTKKSIHPKRAEFTAETLLLPPAALPIVPSVDSLMESLCEDEEMEVCDLYRIISDMLHAFKNDSNVSITKTQVETSPKKIEELKLLKTAINLKFFDAKKTTRMHHLFPLSAMRSALLYNWRKKTKELELFLKDHLIGQDKAIEEFVLIVFGHYSKRIKELFIHHMETINAHSFVELLKEEDFPTSVLLAGPSGTGKTEMVKLTARFLGYPIGRASGSNLTAAGYKGDDTCDAVNQLLHEAKALSDNYQQLAEDWGMIFIDEIDKTSVGTDHFREGAQTALLTLVEGSQKVKVEEESNKIFVDTKKILFMFAGAFSYLNKTHTDEDITHDDLIAYGLLPELVNRIHSIIKIRSLKKIDFIKFILHENISPLYRCLREHSQYHKHIKINFSVEALEFLATHLELKKTSARNVYSILVKIINFSHSIYHQQEKTLHDLFSINEASLRLLEANNFTALRVLITKHINLTDKLENIFEEPLKSFINQNKINRTSRKINISEDTKEGFIKILNEEQELYRAHKQKIKLLTRIININTELMKLFLKDVNIASSPPPGIL